MKKKPIKKISKYKCKICEYEKKHNYGPNHICGKPMFSKGASKAALQQREASVMQSEMEDFWDYLCSELEILEDAEKQDIVREYGRRIKKEASVMPDIPYLKYDGIYLPKKWCKDIKDLRIHITSNHGKVHEFLHGEYVESLMLQAREEVKNKYMEDSLKFFKDMQKTALTAKEPAFYHEMNSQVRYFQKQLKNKKG